MLIKLVRNLILTCHHVLLLYLCQTLLS